MVDEVPTFLTIAASSQQSFSASAAKGSAGFNTSSKQAGSVTISTERPHSQASGARGLLREGPSRRSLLVQQRALSSPSVELLEEQLWNVFSACGKNSSGNISGSECVRALEALGVFAGLKQPALEEQGERLVRWEEFRSLAKQITRRQQQPELRQEPPRKEVPSFLKKDRPSFAQIAMRALEEQRSQRPSTSQSAGALRPHPTTSYERPSTVQGGSRGASRGGHGFTRSGSAWLSCSGSPQAREGASVPYTGCASSSMLLASRSFASSSAPWLSPPPPAAGSSEWLANRRLRPPKPPKYPRAPAPFEQRPKEEGRAEARAVPLLPYIVSDRSELRRI